MPAQPLPGSIATASTLAFALVHKYVDGTPLYRLAQTFERAGVRFSPRYHLATPKAVNFNAGVKPRVIDDAMWLRLIWASLNLEQEDLLSDRWYPLALIQALAVVWTHCGLRQNEVSRLAVGCVKAQAEEIVNEDGSTVAAGTLCYLDVPPSKTFRAYVKPVAAVVKERIDAWAAQRPSDQAPLLDERTGERVNFLFQYRGRRVGTTLMNQTIIPILCAKAGLPARDGMGSITSHRGRASAVTALASVPKGMSLIELMEWSGHTSPQSTMHYIRIRPTRLAASFAQADHMAHMVAVLVDHDAIARKSGEPYAFYDLGDSYCSYAAGHRPSGAPVRIGWRARDAISMCPKPAPWRKLSKARLRSVAISRKFH